MKNISIIECVKHKPVTIESNTKTLFYATGDGEYWVIDKYNYSSSTDEEIKKALDNPYYVGENFNQALEELIRE